MKRLYYISAKWRQRDIHFLSSLGLKKRIEKGYHSFTVDSSELFEEINEHFTKKSSIFYRNMPKDYLALPATAEFTKRELDEAKFFALRYSGESQGMPQPHDLYVEDTFEYDCSKCLAGKNQKANFKIDEPCLKESQVNFILTDFDILFFKKEFFNQHLRGWNLKSKDVINYETGKISDSIIQLEVPEAKSSLEIKGGEFGKILSCEICYSKQYPLQILDFFPSFKDDFEFSICKTKEEFAGGIRRIIVSKKFSEFLVEHGIIKYNQNQLVPVRY